VIYGARVGGPGIVVDPGSVSERATGRSWNARRPDASGDYPVIAGQRFAAVCRTVVTHWTARPDLPRVRQVAAVHHSGWLLN
jgi:hypothetical protein